LRWLLEEAALYLFEGDHFDRTTPMAQRLAIFKL
jgi:hypothetical protein